MSVSYILKTKSGSPWMTFDSEHRARAVQAERAEKKVPLVLVKQTIHEEPMT